MDFNDFQILLNRIDTLDFTEVLQGYKLIIIIVGVLLMVAGFLLHQLAVAIPGFILGSMIGLFIAQLINDDHTTLFGLFGGLAGAALAVFIEFLIIFLLGASTAIILLYFITDDPSTILIVVVGLAGGIITLKFWKFCIIVITSIIGSFLFCSATGTLHSILPILLAMIGIAIQYGLITLFPSLKKIYSEGYKSS